MAVGGRSMIASDSTCIHERSAERFRLLPFRGTKGFRKRETDGEREGERDAHARKRCA